MDIPNISDFNVKSDTQEGKLGFVVEGKFKGRPVSVFIEEGNELDINDAVVLMDIKVNGEKFDSNTKFTHFKDKTSDSIQRLFSRAVIENDKSK